MPSNFTIPSKGPATFKGYLWNSRNPEYLGNGSINCIVTEEGKAVKRGGYQEAFQLDTTGRATPIYHKTYNVAVFAIGTKVYYRDFTTNTTVDTGITLTAGTVTRYEEALGDIYLSNTTDGVYVIRFMRLNDSAATLGDGTVTIDQDGAGRIAAFGDIAAGGTADDLRINGTNEQMASLVVSTGVVTLSGTLSQSYADNTLAIVVRQYSSLEKASKILLWKWRLHLMGFLSAVNADQPNNTVMAGQFIAGQTAAQGIELLVDFTYGTGGSTKILVYGGGKVTNILSVKDFIYFFTQDKTFAAANSEVTTSGSAIGDTRPDEKDELHGCLNEDCATLMGDNAITYVTNDQRIMRIPIDTDSGAALSHPEEDFDVPIRGHLGNMSKNQTGALVYHYRAGRQTIYQLKIAGQWHWFIYDHNIRTSMGSTVFKGAWQPPQLIAPVGGLFEVDGVLYGTDTSNGKVYSIFTTFADNLAPISCTIASAEMECGNAMLKTAMLKGDINHPAEINLTCTVWNDKGPRTGRPKVVRGSSYSYSPNNSVGAYPVGGAAGSGFSTLYARWNKSFGIFPSQGNMCQLKATESKDGGYFSVSSLLITGRQLSGVSTKTL